MKNSPSVRVLSNPIQNKGPFLPTLPMPYQCKECTVYGWRPETREGATLTTIPAHMWKGKWLEERTYMFGGLSRSLYSEISYLTVNEFYNEYTWTLQDKGIAEYKRYGHTACTYEGRLIITGGARMFNRDQKRRECLGDVLVYNPGDNSWKELFNSGSFYEARRYHASCVFGNYLIVHGGLNERDKWLDSVCALSLSGITELENDPDKEFRWLNVNAENQGLGPTAYHTCNAVLEVEHYRSAKLVTLTSMADAKSFQAKIPYEGIYYFGGRNALGANNDVYILRLGRKPIEWIKPEIKGKKPPPRYAHSADYIAEKGILIVFGGRNDEGSEVTGTFCMNDIWILSVENLEWTEWKSPEPIDPQPRYSHATAIAGKSIIIFGGLGETSYCSSNLYEISMTKKNDIGKKGKQNRGEARRPSLGGQITKKLSMISLKKFSSNNLGIFTKLILGSLTKLGYKMQ